MRHPMASRHERQNPAGANREAPLAKKVAFWRNSWQMVLRIDAFAAHTVMTHVWHARPFRTREGAYDA